MKKNIYDMKKRLLLLSAVLLFSLGAFAQQIPLTDSYFINKYALSPAYAGNSENGYLFANYLNYWTGISVAPKTLRLSYQNGFKNKKIGLGGNIISYKAGAFQTFLGMASYSYRLKLSSSDKILFGLSAGFIRNSVNLSEFMNNPLYSSDPALSQNDLAPRTRFASEISMVYVLNNFQVGMLFSNTNFGENAYTQNITHYNPLSIYQFHALYTIPFIDDIWKFSALAIYRGGKNIKNQFEIASQVKYSNKLWASLGFHGQNMFSIGAGLRVSKSIIINYNYNFPAGSNFPALQIYEFSLGIKL